MKEIKEIVAAYDIATSQGLKTALATVVLVEGSAYRRAGARMLIGEDGRLTGAISGGCLEGDALRKARLVIMQQEPLLVTYDTTDDDDAKLGVGLGCNGIIHILIEPLDEHPDNPISLLKAIVDKRQYAVLITMFSIADRKAPQPGTCLCMTEENTLTGRSENAAHRLALINDAARVLKTRQSEIKGYSGIAAYTAFVECIKPSISLIIAGAGNDAMPLTAIAAVLGWEITVIDGRPGYATAGRFPFAKKVMVARPEEVLSLIELNEWTALVLMTHNYNYEIALLKYLLPLHLPYVGVLGPKKKMERMLSELEKESFTISSTMLHNVYSPVGLDIGAEGAEEIALAVISEIKAVLSSRQGNSLKYKPAPIHTTELQPILNK